MTNNKKRRNPNGASGNKPSPRRGDKTKQTKGMTQKETDQKVVRQTKLSFADPPTPNATAAPIIAITPDIRHMSKRLAHPTPPHTPDRENNDHNNNSKTYMKKAPSNDVNKKKPPPKARFITDADTTVARMPDTPMETEETENNDEGTQKQNKQHNTTPTINDALKPAAKSSTKTRNSKSTTQAARLHYKEIRYRGIIDAPPSERPLQDFVLLLKKYLLTVQSLLSKHIYLAPWDKEQESSFTHLKTPNDVPDSRESLGIYLGTYVNPKSEGNPIWMNLRWVTSREPPVALERFGMELADALPKHKMSMNKQPQPCQAAKSCCIGWFMYSCKQINSTAFITETKAALGIPSEVAIGISYRTIVNQYGKKPPFNREDPPAAAIHLDIDERFYMVFQAKASSLWRKNSKKRLPNGVQLRLVPCFSSPIGKSMTDEIRADAKTLAERQYFFVKEHIRVIEYHFISLLDTPISKQNTMTLRRAMMARAPKDRPTSRLIHNVDQSWNSTSKYVVTTVVGREEEANRFLSNLIPELLFTHGPEASKWFSGQGLSVYKDVRWNPTKGTTSSTNARASADMVEEDLWDLGEKWKSLTVNPQKTEQRPNAKKLDTTAPKEPLSEAARTAAASIKLSERLAGDKSVASFGGAFGRDKDSDDEEETKKLAADAAANPPDMTGTQFIFSPAQVARDKEKADQCSDSDGKSMSTAGKTTDGTRLKLKIAQEELVTIKLAAQEEIASLRRALQLQNDPSKIPLPTDSSDDMETDPEPTNAQLLGSALAAPKRESIQQDSDDMEDDEHPTTYIGDDKSTPSSGTDEEARYIAKLEAPDTSSTVADSLEESHAVQFIGSDPSSSSSSDPSQSSASTSSHAKESKVTSSESETSSSSSSSSNGSHDTAELVEKIIKNTPPKNLIKTDRPDGSTDSRQSTVIRSRFGVFKGSHPWRALWQSQRCH